MKKRKKKKENAVGEGRVFGLFVYCLFLVLYHTVFVLGREDERASLLVEGTQLKEDRL